MLDECHSYSGFEMPDLSRPVSLLCLFLALSCAACAQAPSSESSLVAPDWCRKLPRPEYSRLQRIPVHDTWFEVYSVAPHVLAIYEPHQWQETVMYLVEGSQRALLIDTGMGIGDLHALVSQLTKLPVIVVNSHTHTDHTGDNWQFSNIASLNTTFTRTSAKGSTDVRTEIESGKLCGALPAAFDPANYVRRPWKTTRLLHDGDTIDLGGRILTVLFTPGHAPDSLCLFDRKNGLLFTGDTYYPGPIYVFGPGSDPAAYQKSVDRLAAFAPRVRLVLGAHNVPGTPPEILTELASEFAAVRAGKLRGVKAEDGLMKYTGPQITFFTEASHAPSSR